MDDPADILRSLTLKQWAIDRFQASGIDHRDLARWLIEDGCAPAACTQACFWAGRWNPADDGERALVAPLTVRGEILDLVAWPENRPGHLATLCGEPILGVDNVVEADWRDAPAMFWPTAGDWLRAKRHGAVIIDYRRAPAFIGGLRRAIAATDRLSNQMKASMPWLDVRVAEQRGAA